MWDSFDWFISGVWSIQVCMCAMWIYGFSAVSTKALSTVLNLLYEPFPSPFNLPGSISARSSPRCICQYCALKFVIQGSITLKGNTCRYDYKTFTSYAYSCNKKVILLGALPLIRSHTLLWVSRLIPSLTFAYLAPGHSARSTIKLVYRAIANLIWPDTNLLVGDQC